MPTTLTEDTIPARCKPQSASFCYGIKGIFTAHTGLPGR